MVSFRSGFILFLEDQKFPIHSVEIKGIAPNKYFTPSLIYLPHENSLQTFSWLNLNKKMVALVAEVNPVPEEMNWKFLVTLNSFGTWKKEKKNVFIWNYFLFPVFWSRILYCLASNNVNTATQSWSSWKGNRFIHYIRNTAHKLRRLAWWGFSSHFDCWHATTLPEKNYTSSALGARDWLYTLKPNHPEFSRT